MTDVIKYLKVLVQLESVPLQLGYSLSKEALWTRAVNFLLPRLPSAHPEIKRFTYRLQVPDANTSASFVSPTCFLILSRNSRTELLMYLQMAFNHHCEHVRNRLF